ncbi:SCAN domain-containing protein 3-like [Octopus bimaculoides]|uniref:SCAN domain-containing protein 3-like n=1 Tax=Octopus bimaculoides TaxID=37653 RepID=UPI0022E88F99|nr:SCAN domain-containing protein 3-like [Octopus bimaculoides]
MTIVQVMPLSNNTVSRRIDEMREDIVTQLVEKLKSRKFPLQMDESTLRDSEVILLTYARYIDKEKITSCAAEGAPVMMGKKNVCLKLVKDENPEMLLVHCVIHRENLISKNMSPILNEVLKSVIKCIKVNTKCERLFKQFCENADYVRLLSHPEVRWLSKGNCLKRFMELFDVSDFLSDKPEMKHLLTVDGKAFVSYLTDICEKLNMLNEQLQGSNKILIDLTNFARKLLLPFPSSSLAECGFSAVNDLLLKKRN